MYLVGFYSPKENAGVTNTSLLIYKWLRSYTQKSVGFVSNHQLQHEPETNEVFHNFAHLSLSDQKKKMKKLKSKFDIVIFDASSGLNDDVFQLLSITDRLFILGEENMQFAQSLHHFIEFNYNFDPKTKNFLSHLEGNRTFILGNKNTEKVGFTDSNANIGETAQIIYDDFVCYYIEQKYVEQNRLLLKKLKQAKLTEFRPTLYKLGYDFEVAVLFEKFLHLRLALGQSYQRALEDLFPQFNQNPYSDVLKNFQNELYVAQINFQNPTYAPKELEEIEEIGETEE